MPNKCPTCEAPAPHLHPAVQHEGEVQVCRDQWHQTLTPQNRTPSQPPEARHFKVEQTEAPRP